MIEAGPVFRIYEEEVVWKDIIPTESVIWMVEKFDTIGV